VWHTTLRPVALITLGSALIASHARAQDPPPAQAQAPAEAAAAVPKLPPPPPIVEEQLGPILKTTPMQRRPPGPNQTQAESKVLPKDKQGIWVLDFVFKPIRLREVEVSGKRRTYHYMYYRVSNHTGKPRLFVPQFTLVTDTGKRYEDIAGVPQAIDLIKYREDPTVPLYGAVDINGILPPSTKEGVDDTVTGVAIWENVDPEADGFKVYVRGLSDGYQLLTPPGGDKNKRVIRDKTLRIDFVRFGDGRNLREREILLADPPYEWIYWGDRPEAKP
jgi:hypothetical protein